MAYAIEILNLCLIELRMVWDHHFQFPINFSERQPDQQSVAMIFFPLFLREFCRLTLCFGESSYDVVVVADFAYKRYRLGFAYKRRRSRNRSSRSANVNGCRRNCSSTPCRCCSAKITGCSCNCSWGCCCSGSTKRRCCRNRHCTYFEGGWGNCFSRDLPNVASSAVREEYVIILIKSHLMKSWPSSQHNRWRAALQPPA